MFRWEEPVTVIKGIGPKTAAELNKLEINTVGDLLHHYPLRYDRPEAVVPIREAPFNETTAVEGLLRKPLSSRYVSGKNLTTGSVEDESGHLQISFFNMPYVKNSLHSGDVKVFRGVIRMIGRTRSMTQPQCFDPEEYETLSRSICPVYGLTAGIGQKKLTAAVRAAAEQAEAAEETFPAELLAEGFMGRQEAFRNIHFPESEEKLAAARKRLVFEEFLAFLLKCRLMKNGERDQGNPAPMPLSAKAEAFREQLPYELTGAQKRVWQEIRMDLAGTHRMNRLVQGDVGSGKTAIALLALLTAWENGFQGALMAPTEVLAVQHYEKITALLEKAGLPVRCELLTGSLKESEKKAARARIACGEADIVIGTHALIQDKVEFARLGLAVTDEQHRFGVKQREHLAGQSSRPHTLVMSATPIPRTLAIILYGDLDVSVIDELPKNRRPIKNCVVGPSYRNSAYRFMAERIREGRQIYIVCPMVEESEGFDGENVTDYAESIRGIFPASVRIGTLHGRMKPSEKNAVMEAFSQGNIDILVSTTVIEVGVDVPNATVMMVENAERFGLAQLHQLRGRVGRGNEQSYAIFVDGSGRKEKNERLEVLNRSNDGFEIAAEDLRLRGPGDLFGIRQSGELDFKLGNIYNDHELLLLASEKAAALLKADPLLSAPAFAALRDEALKADICL